MKQARRALAALRRARKATWQRLAELGRKLGNLRDRFPGKQHKAEKRETKHKIARAERRKGNINRQVERKLRWLEDHKEPKPAATSVIGYWDGRQVAGWMVGTAPGPGGTRRNWLQEIQNHGWGGGIYSGYRSPAYSESLCYGICGHPSCSGVCAGASSNHSGSVYPGGAIDVVDWPAFERGNAAVGGPFHNYLPYDKPHHSVSGR